MSERAALLRRTGTTSRGRRYLIRPTSDGDAPALVVLHDSVAAEGGVIASLPGERTAMEEELTLAGIRSSGGLALTVEVEGALSGALAMQRHPARWHRHRAEVALAIDRRYRREGLGRMLMETGIEWARAVGITKICLDVFPDNTAAVGLYRSLGFEEEGVRRQDVLMPDGHRDVLGMALLL